MEDPVAEEDRNRETGLDPFDRYSRMARPLPDELEDEKSRRTVRAELPPEVESVRRTPDVPSRAEE